MSLRNKLNRLKPHLSGEQQPEKVISFREPKVIEVPFRDQWEKAGVTTYFLDQDYCLIREVIYPLETQHGHYRFHDLLTAIEIWNSRGIGHPLSAKGYKKGDLFFFDIETTGLGSGVGNTIFLLGYASISEDQLILRQHILPHPGAEIPLYHSFLEHINYKTLVTYNGKSFDWPQVRTRHTLVREHVPKLPAFGHFDLFHAAKRLWKHKLDRLKLAVVEKEVLGVERVEDIPGYLAPMIYFDFVESKQPEGMLGILKHNEIDILSLVTLYTHLTFQLNGIDHKQTRKESYEVGRWFAAIGEKAEAEKVLTKLTKVKDDTSFQAKRTMALQHKKAREWEKAEKLFLDIVDSANIDMVLEGCVELAKIYEHRIKDIPKALEYCEKALTCAVQSDKLFNEKNEVFNEQLKIRHERLIRKYAKFPG